MKKKLIVIVFTALLTLSAVILIPISTSKPVKTIEIGVINPSWVDIEPRTAFYMMMQDEINEYLGQLPGRGNSPRLQVNFIYEGPTEEEVWLNTDTHLEKVQALHAQGVEFFIAGWWSAFFAGTLDYIHEHDLLMVSPSSTSPDPLLTLDDNAFRLAPPDTNQAEVLNQILLTYRDGEGIDALVVILRDDDWANGLTQALRDVYNGEIVEIPYPLDPIPDLTNYVSQAEDAAQGLVTQYGEDHVGVLMIAFEEGVNILQLAAGYTTIYGLPWFGAEETGRSLAILEYAGEEACNVSLISAIGSIPNTIKFNDLAERWAPYGYGEAGFYTVTHADAAWLIVQAVLDTRDIGSVHPSGADVVTVFPDVAYRYFGYSGWTLLDENGDRATMDYDIWGFGPDAVTSYPSIINYGVFDSVSGEMLWEYNPPPWEAPDCIPPP